MNEQVMQMSSAVVVNMVVAGLQARARGDEATATGALEAAETTRVALQVSKAAVQQQIIDQHVPSAMQQVAASRQQLLFAEAVLAALNEYVA